MEHPKGSTVIPSLRKALLEANRYKKRYYRAIKKGLPKGTRVHFSRGRGVVIATIMDVSDDRVLIMSDRMKHYWLDVYWIIDNSVTNPVLPGRGR